MAKKKYMFQGNDFSCFPIAVYNAAVYLNIHGGCNFKKLLEVAKCEHGGTINETKVIQSSGIPLVKAKKVKFLFKRGGVITIMHPIFNLHACFIEPERNGRIKIINSFLGPNEMVIDVETLTRFLAKYPNNNHYRLIKEEPK